MFTTYICIYSKFYKWFICLFSNCNNMFFLNRI